MREPRQAVADRDLVVAALDAGSTSAKMVRSASRGGGWTWWREEPSEGGCRTRNQGDPFSSLRVGGQGRGSDPRLVRATARADNRGFIIRRARAESRASPQLSTHARAHTAYVRDRLGGQPGLVAGEPPDPL